MPRRRSLARAVGARLRTPFPSVDAGAVDAALAAEAAAPRPFAGGEERAPAKPRGSARATTSAPGGLSPLARTLEALLFLSSEPVPSAALADAAEADQEELDAALAELREAYAPGTRGIELRELAGGFTLATAADTEPAARRLLAKPRTPPLSPAQAETLAIIAYLQPVSRPEITRIRGVSADSAAGTLLERGLIEEGGRSPFGAVLYRTTPLFLKLFGLKSLDDLPEVEQWDPSPEEAADLRERLLKAGEARTGLAAAAPDPVAAADGEAVPGAPEGEAPVAVAEAPAGDPPPPGDEPG